MDTRFTSLLTEAYPTWRKLWEATGDALPENFGTVPDLKLRRLDCALINWAVGYFGTRAGVTYDTVRCAFTEGAPAFPGSKIMRESHIQLTVRSQEQILGVFLPRSTPAIGV